MASSLFYVLFASLFAVVCAQNLPPPIIVPKTGDVWKAGERQTVKWSIDGINVYDPGLNPLRGKIFIGHLTNNSRYIWFTEPLASDFTYLQQQVDIIVPTFPTAHNYFLVLVGQSDNWSQFFTIENPADPSGTGTLGTSVTINTISASQTASSVSTSASASSTSTATSISASVTGSTTSTSVSSTSSVGSTSASVEAPPSSTSASSMTASSATSSGTSSATVLSVPSSSSTAPASGGSNNGASANAISIVSAGAAVVLSFIFLVS
ncbi:hypothetical protein L227DRAFT_214006 [Lentinus tigrinus ALCF2SS1-6]|uniref:Ser-Thr-rich glycosyl-phosphatidyl-inositol-anchored membrane family-domain-containing protein n=1 Tax=Lentinus tigrinus ALCF2SS1-6 TaxID=1328759 RepID=A0A5C2SQU6_9APHY|nr:hypothetical protein L227DRAFT_214006 [Lentinus tigrinus ALCF2SS1-6]